MIGRFGALSRLTQYIRPFAVTLLLALCGPTLFSCGHEALIEDDSCIYADDGVCDDDSYLISTTSVCEEGTDSTDCNRQPVCEDTCIWSEDGDCDDGGADSVTSVCDLGSDCSDCGPR